MSLFIYLFMCVPVCALITETQGKLFSWNVQMFWWIWRNIQITAFSVVFHLGTVKRPVITSFLSPFSPKAPSAPSFIHFSELTTTSVNVSWGEPKQANGIIEGYRLVYEPCTPVDGEKLLPGA